MTKRKITEKFIINKIERKGSFLKALAILAFASIFIVFSFFCFSTARDFSKRYSDSRPIFLLIVVFLTYSILFIYLLYKGFKLINKVIEEEKSNCKIAVEDLGLSSEKEIEVICTNEKSLKTEYRRLIKKYHARLFVILSPDAKIKITLLETDGDKTVISRLGNFTKFISYYESKY